MRNHILLTLINLIAGATISLAQLKTEMGIKAGLSIPNLTSGSSGNPLSEGYGSRLDADIAIHFELHIWNKVSIQPQLEYSSQGGKKNGTQAFTTPDELAQQFPPGQAPSYLYADYNSEAKFTYLMLPVLLKYHFYDHKKWNAYVAAGPFISYLLHAKNITKGSSVIYLDEGKTTPLSPAPQSFDSNDNITSELNRINAGINGHLGLSYKLTNGNVFLEAGGNFGFINVQKNEADGKNKVGAAVITIGYGFTL